MLVGPADLLLDQRTITPRLGTEGVILAVAGGDRRAAAQVFSQAEADGVTQNVHPDVAPCGAAAPLEDHPGIVLLEHATAFEGLAVQAEQQLGHATRA